MYVIPWSPPKQNCSMYCFLQKFFIYFGRKRRGLEVKLKKGEDGKVMWLKTNK